MQRLVEKLYKQNGTPVSVQFGPALQLLLLNFKDWQQELRSIWTAHVRADISGVYEPTISHGIACHCCTRTVAESYTHPTLIESRREWRPGRPRQRGSA